MANNNGGQLNFGVGFNVDSSGLNKLKASLQQLQSATTKDLVNVDASKARAELTDIKSTASSVEAALMKAFNPKLNSVNVTKFNSELEKTGLNLNTIYEQFSKLGSQGQTAFTNLSASLLTTNVKLKESKSLIDKMGETLVNTIKWNVASSAINAFTTGIQNAYNYVKVLDSSLTDIRIVTGQSRDEMDDFARSANSAAQALGRQTKDYTNAYLTFAQQGLNPEQATARTQATLKASNITGANVGDMANDLTAVWNGFQIQAGNTEKAVSKLAAVADTSASDMSELATAMSKSASIANNMGVTIDQLAAQIATITQITRQAPETTGNALKTIYARINDIKAGTDDAEVSLGNYTKKMAELGVNVLDENKNLRDTGDVITEIGNKWNTMSREQQIYLAQTMAGQRQMNNLIALFDNWDVYTKELNTSLAANNELNEKNDIYMDSMTAHLNQLTAAQEGLIQSLSDTDSFKGLIDVGTQILTIFTKISDSIGGGGTVILSLASSLTGLFSKQIGNELNSFITNIQNGLSNAKQLKTIVDEINTMASVSGIQDNSAVTAMVDAQKEISKYYSVMSEEQINQYNDLVRNLGLAEQQKNNLQEQVDLAAKLNTALTGNDVKSENLIGDSDEAADFAYKLEELTENYEVLTEAEKEFYNVAKDSSAADAIDELNTLKAAAQELVKTFEGNAPQAVQDFVDKLNNFDPAKDKITDITMAFATLKHDLGQDITAGTEIDKLSSQLSQAKTNVDNLNTSVDDYQKKAEQAFNSQNIVKTVSAVGQLVSISNSLGHLGNIFNDGDLSQTQKIQQVLTNLFTMTIPMGISAFTKLRKIISSTFGANVAARRVEEIEQWKQTSLATTESDLTKGLITQKQYQANVRTINAHAAKAEAAAISTVGTVLSGAMLVITGVVAAYQAYTNSVHEANQAIIDQKDKLIDSENQKQAEIKNNRDLAQSYLEVYKQYKDGTASKEDMDAAAATLSDTLDKEAISVANLTGNYDALTEAIKKNSKQQLGEAKASAERQQNKLDQSAQATFKEAGGTTWMTGGLDEKGLYSGSYKGSILIDPGIINDSLSRQVQQMALDQLSDAFQNVQNGGVYIGLKNFDAKSIIKQYHEIDDFLSGLSNELQNSDAAQNLAKYRDSLEDFVTQAESANDAMRDADATIEASNLFTDDVKTLDDYNAKKQELVNWLKSHPEYSEGKTDDDLDQLAQGYINDLSDKFKNLQAESNTIDAIVSKFKKSVQDDARKEIEKANLSDDELTILYNAEIDDKTSMASLKTFIKEAKEQAQNEVIGATTDLTDQVSEIIQKAHDQRQQNSKSGNEKVTKGKTYTKSDKQTIEGLTDSLDDETANTIGKDRLALLEDQNASLKEQYGVLQQIRDLTTQQNLEAAMSASKNAALENEKALNEAKDELSALEDKAKELGDALADDSITGGMRAGMMQDLEDVTKQIQDLKDYIDNQDFTIDIRAEVDQNMLDYFEGQVQNITEDSNLLAQAASLVGQNYQVAANDVASLADIFPDILNNAQVLADGTVQLDQQVVQQVLSGQAQILQGDTDTVNARLQNQVSMLDAEIAYCDQRLAIYQQLIDGKITESEAQQQLDQAAAQFGEQMANAVGKSWTEAQNQATNNNAANANAVIGNLNLIGQTAAAVSQAVAAAMAGEATSYSPVGGGTKGASGTGFSESSNVGAYASANKTSQGVAKDRIAAIEKQMANVQAERDSAQELKNDYLSLIAKNTANTANAVKKADYAQAGKGGAYNPEQDKSGKKKGSGSGSKEKLKDKEEVLKDVIIDEETELDILKKQSDEYDRQNKDLERRLKRLEKNEDKAIRRGKTETIDKENALIEKQQELYQNKVIPNLEKRAQVEGNNIATLASQIGLQGVQIDNQGNIVNYTDLAIQYQKIYNDLLNQAANAGTKAEQDKALQQAKNAKERWKELQTSITNMQNYSDSIDEAYDKLNELQDQQEENAIKQFKIQIDTDLDIAGAKRDWDKFKKQVIDKIKDKDFVGQAKARMQDFFSYYDSTGKGIIQQLTNHVSKTRAALEQIENGDYSGPYGRNEAQALEDLKKYTDDLMENLEDVQQITKDIHEYLLDVIDKAQDAFNDQKDLYEQVADQIKHDANLTKLLHGDNDYNDLEKFYDMQAQNNNQMIDFYRKQSDMWKQQMDNAEKGSDEWKKFKENWMSSISDLNSAVEDAVQNLLDKYNNTINKITRDTKNRLMGGDWQKALDEWDKAKWNDSRYLDKASRAAGVLDFVDNVNNAMNNQSPRVQKQLSDFLDKEVNDLNSIANLRQIDLDIANKKLEVLQKQIVLEDIQNAKTQMRLRRDSQGNYTYQYVADEDQTQSAQTDLRDSIEELRQLAKKDVSDTIDEVQDKLQDFFEKAQELSQTYYDDQETLQEKLLELQEEYFGDDGYITVIGQDYNNMQSELINLTGVEFGNLLTEMGDELQAFLGLNGDDENDQAVWASIQALIGEGGAIPTLFDAFINDTYLKNFNLMTEANQDLLFGKDTGLDPSWNTAIGDMAENYIAMTGEVIIPCMQAMIDANGTYIQSLDAVQQAAGISFQNAVNGIDTTIGYTQALIQDNDTLVDSYNNEVNAVNSVYQAIKGLVSQYGNAEAAAIDAANAALKYWAAVQGHTIGDVYSGGQHHYDGGHIDTSPSKPAKTTTSGSNNGTYHSSGNNGRKPSSTPSKPTEQARYKIVQQTNKSGHWETTRDADLMNSDRTGTTSKQYAESRLDNYFNGGKAQTEFEGYQTRYQVVKMDTGGYTGEWNDKSGKLAFLHQKELVLNQKDTKNTLAAVKIASGIINSVAGLGSNILNNLIAGREISNILTNNNRNADNSVQQNVKIEATFPNVQSSQEIEKAFNNLVNAASQRAAGNRRTY